MASSNHDFDDQTDEDFFDKLVDGEFDDPESKAKELLRDLSNSSLESDFGKSLESADATKNDSLNLTKSNSEIEIGFESNLPIQSSVEEVQWGAFSVDSLNESEKSSTFDCLRFSVETPDAFEESLAENISSKHENLKSHDTEKNDSLVVNSNYSKLESGTKSGLSKQTSVKEVQWGAFSGDSLDEIEKYPISDYSGFLAEDVNGGFAESTVDTSSNVGLVEQHYKSATEHLNNSDLILEKSASVVSNGVKVDTKSNASKGTSVKEVKWSDFNADSSQEIENIYGFNSFEPYSASSIENSNEFVDKFSLSTSSSDKQYDYSSTGKCTADQNDPQYWEKLYPGWKFDSSSGQWYQVDNSIAATDTQFDNSNVAGADSVFVNSDASYNIPQPSQSVLETVNEENISSSINLNNDSQVIVNYPPHMVFDPQYPGWYYDTNTQEWYTLESYGHRVNDNSNPLQDLSPEQNNSLYSKVQEEGTQKFGQSWDASLSSYNQKIDSNDNISQSQQTISKDLGSLKSSQMSAFTSNYIEQNHFSNTINQFEKQTDQNKANVQQSMWQPQPLNSRKQDVSLSSSYYGNQATTKFSQQSFNGANTYDQSEKQINQNIISETNAQQSMWPPQPLKNHIGDAILSKSNNSATGNYSQQSSNGASMYNQSGKHTNQNIVSIADAQQSIWQHQPFKSHIEDANLSKSNYGDQATMSYSQQSFTGANAYDRSEKQTNQNIGSKTYAQQSLWQPQPFKSHIEDANLSKSNYSDQATMSHSPQSFTSANAYDQSEKQTNQNVDSKTYAQQSPWQPQPLKSHIEEANLPKSNYGDQGTMSYPPQSFTGANAYEQSEKQTNQNIASITYAQQSMWQPQPLKSHINDAYLSKSNNDDQGSINYSQQFYNGSNVYNSQLSSAPIDGRSSAGRPPHALVTFGFGGKLLIMKDVSFAGGNLDSGNQVRGSNAISVLNLHEFVTEKSDYFNALCQSSFPGPLVGGSAASKDATKWVDEKIVKYESSTMDFQNAKFMKMLYSLLKITCQHYGKLRSSFGADLPLETDGPDAAVTKLFASVKKDGTHLTEFGSLSHCVLNIPSEGQIQATAIEVQKFLVSGRRKEALQYAQEGQLWGAALVIASQLGDNFYVDTVKKMAECQFASGTPLRTLCLLIAGKPTDVFSNNSYRNSFYGASVGNYGSTQVPAGSILDAWEENLAIICANRTKDDELVIIHLGDCLYKERAEIIPAHVCYLLAEASFELYSDSARLCLIGADHWKCPRTYASPEAIQRTEVYEYSKVLGNSQFVLLPLQPYKLVYAHMLAEVGKVSDSLRYCQSLHKLLKNPGQAPEIEIWKALLSSLEERLRTHQQGGYSSNLAPAKLVGKLFNSLDRSITRIIGSPPSTLPPMPQNSANSKENFFSPVSKVASSQSTMDVALLTPSASVEAISQWSDNGNTTSTHNRSVSEPEVGKSSEPNPSKDATSAKVQSSSSDTSSKFGRIGSQLFQKTFGWVSKSRQAKLGESNKFYYDEKLKRWVEEGAEPPAEEITPPPPPKAPTFQNGASDYNISNAFKDNSPPPNGIMEQKSPGSSDLNSGIPPIPPTQNQFSARGRMGVRSRYVDTFNKGASNPSSGTIKSSFQPPVAPSIKPAINTKFFVPTAPAPSNDDQQNDTVKEATEQPTPNTEPPSSSSTKEMSFSPPPSSPPPSSLQKFPSMDNIPPYTSHNLTSPPSYNRAVSWSGVYSDTNKVQNPQSTPSSDGGILGDELQEVEL